LEEKVYIFHYWTAREGTSMINTRRRFAFKASEDEVSGIEKELEEKAKRILDSELERKLVELYSFGQRLDVGCGDHPMGEVGLDRVKGSKVMVQGEGTSLPFRTESFDTIIAHHCLEHIPKLGRALTEIYRVTRSLVVIVVPRKEASYVHVDHVWHMNREEWEGILRKGFFIESSGEVGNSYYFICCKYSPNSV